MEPVCFPFWICTQLINVSLFIIRSICYIVIFFLQIFSGNCQEKLQKHKNTPEKCWLFTCVVFFRPVDIKTFGVLDVQGKVWQSSFSGVPGGNYILLLQWRGENSDRLPCPIKVENPRGELRRIRPSSNCWLNTFSFQGASRDQEVLEQENTGPGLQAESPKRQ